MVNVCKSIWRPVEARSKKLPPEAQKTHQDMQRRFVLRNSAHGSESRGLLMPTWRAARHDVERVASAIGPDDGRVRVTRCGQRRPNARSALLLRPRTISR